MRSTATENTKAPPYPCLKVVPSSGKVVLFTTCTKGTCVHSGRGFDETGLYTEAWDDEQFIPYTGQITLQND